MTTTTDDWEHARESALATFECIDELFAKVDEHDDDQEAQDAVYEELREMPLSLLVRGDWVEPGQESKPTEFELLMGTGGPAVRIRGDLNEYGEPTRAYIQAQDWATPWFDVFPVRMGFGAVLLRFAGLFYYGEG